MVCCALQRVRVLRLCAAARQLTQCSLKDNGKVQTLRADHLIMAMHLQRRSAAKRSVTGCEEGHCQKTRMNALHGFLLYECCGHCSNRLRVCFSHGNLAVLAVDAPAENAVVPTSRSSRTQTLCSTHFAQTCYSLGMAGWHCDPTGSFGVTLSLPSCSAGTIGAGLAAVAIPEVVLGGARFGLSSRHL